MRHEHEKAGAEAFFHLRAGITVLAASKMELRRRLGGKLLHGDHHGCSVLRWLVLTPDESRPRRWNRRGERGIEAWVFGIRQLRAGIIFVIVQKDGPFASAAACSRA